MLLTFGFAGYQFSNCAHHQTLSVFFFFSSSNVCCVFMTIIQFPVDLFHGHRHPAAGDPFEEPKAERTGGAGPPGWPAPADDRRLSKLHRSAGEQHHSWRQGRGPAPDPDDGWKVWILILEPCFFHSWGESISLFTIYLYLHTSLNAST